MQILGEVLWEAKERRDPKPHPGIEQNLKSGRTRMNDCQVHLQHHLPLRSLTLLQALWASSYFLKPSQHIPYPRAFAHDTPTV